MVSNSGYPVSSAEYIFLRDGLAFNLPLHHSTAYIKQTNDGTMARTNMKEFHNYSISYGKLSSAHPTKTYSGEMGVTTHETL